MEYFKLMKREISRNSKGDGRVAFTRRGSDTLEALGSGFRGGKKKIPTVWVTEKSGAKYEIPVDPKTGKVPEEYIFARFLNTNAGTRNGHERNILLDIGIDADTLHEVPKGGFTPQQLVNTGWWQHPNESDIIGIDDTGALAFARELEEAAKSAQAQGKKMVFLMPAESAERARSILTKDFNATELRKAVRNGGIIIKEGNPGPGAAGCYISVQETSSLKTPVIILGRDWNEETLVHEFTHHLRHVDNTRDGLSRTPMKLNARGERVPYGRDEESERNSAVNLEEASTVAESLVRIQAPSEGANGYYASTKVHGDTPKERYAYDRAVLVPDKPMRGRKAEKRMKDGFEDTSISHLGHYRPGSNAINYYIKRKSDGTMPKAIKPVRKPKVNAATAAKGPKDPVATANRRYTRARS